MKLKHILILQNKIDLVKESQAKEQYEQILAFVQGELMPVHLLFCGKMPSKMVFMLEICVTLHLSTTYMSVFACSTALTFYG